MIELYSNMNEGVPISYTAMCVSSGGECRYSGHNLQSINASNLDYFFLGAINAFFVTFLLLILAKRELIIKKRT